MAQRRIIFGDGLAPWKRMLAPGVLPNKLLSGRRYLMQVLVVDDHAFVREGVRVFLERHGYTVFEAADVEAALAIARDVNLDAAILDLIIPIAPGEPAPIAAENGIRLGSRLVEQLPHLGIVFLSSYMGFPEYWNGKVVPLCKL